MKVEDSCLRWRTVRKIQEGCFSFLERKTQFALSGLEGHCEEIGNFDYSGM